ncbi:MAG: ParB/RepB/Spo0J family partition protein [Legionellales bacterium]|nr:ParB/RepB/Spo0J family partition protein [Legionellales bacterium]
MSQQHKSLGRNLSALLSQSAIPVTPDTRVMEQVQIEYRPITSLIPGRYQPRRFFSDETIAELADSIRKQGLLQPLVVRELQPGRYEIIAGERRWRACQQVGLSQVPVLIRQVNDETAIALALVENLQREDLSVLDQARSMQRLLVEFSMSHQQIADILSKSRAAVTNHLRLLNLPTEVQMFLEQGVLDMGHARSLLTLPAEEQKRVADIAVAKALSVRETERLVNTVKMKKTDTTKPTATYPKTLQSQLNNLSQQLSTEVQLKLGAAGRGTLVIHYTDLTSLDQIITKILTPVS